MAINNKPLLNQAPGAPGTVAGQGIGGENKPGTGRFSNLQKYIQSNQNANTAQKIGQNISNQASEVGKAVGESKQQFQQQAGQEQNRLNQYGQLQGQVQQGSDLNDQQYQQFQQYRQGQYQKPEIQNIDQLQNQQRALQQRAGLAGSEQGRFQLLRDVFGRPTYSTGQQRLDQLLLQSSPNQLRGLQQTGTQAAQQGQQAIQGFQTEAQAQQAALQQQAQDVQQQARNLVSGQTQALQGAVTGREQQEEAQAKADYEALQQLIATQKTQAPPGAGEGFKIQALPTGPQINEEQYNRILGRLGGSADTQLFGSLKDVDVNQLLNQNALDRETSAYATDQELNRFNQLKRLAGEEGDLLGGFNLNKADAYDPTKLFNQDYLNRLTQQKAGEYQSTVSPHEQSLKQQQESLSRVQGDIGRLGQLDPNTIAQILSGQTGLGIDTQGGKNAFGLGMVGSELSYDDAVRFNRAIQDQNALYGEGGVFKQLTGPMDANTQNFISKSPGAGMNPNFYTYDPNRLRDFFTNALSNSMAGRQQSIADQQKQIADIKNQYGIGENLRSLLGKYKV